MGSWSAYMRIFGNSRMQICKKWLNQLKNFFNKHFKEYYLASSCWWIPSSCENHCTLLNTSCMRSRVGTHRPGTHRSLENVRNGTNGDASLLHRNFYTWERQRAQTRQCTFKTKPVRRPVYCCEMLELCWLYARKTPIKGNHFLTTVRTRFNTADWWWMGPA